MGDDHAGIKGAILNSARPLLDQAPKFTRSGMPALVGQLL